MLKYDYVKVIFIIKKNRYKKNRCMCQPTKFLTKPPIPRKRKSRFY